MKFYIPLVVLTLCLRAVSGSTAIFEHHYISENPAWDFRVMRSVLVDIDKDGKPPLSVAKKHPEFQVTLCRHFVTTNVDFAHIKSE